MSNRAFNSVPRPSAFLQLCAGLRCTVQSVHVTWCECVHTFSPGWWRSSEGILHRTVLSLQTFSSARQGWGWWQVGDGGRMGITHSWPWSASNQSHTHLSQRASHKTTGTEGKRIYHNLYSCPHVWDLTAQMRFCHTSIWWSSERWQEGYILFNIPNYEQGHWRANYFACYACLKLQVKADQTLLSRRACERFNKTT